MTNGIDSTQDLVELLVQDHARMETRLASLVQSMNALGRGTGVDEHCAVVSDTLDYFAKEGARHESLEESLLFPHLRPLPQFVQILAAIEFQHSMNRAEGERLRACIERGSSAPASEMRRLGVRFVEMHRGHVVAEERALFPLLSAALGARALQELGLEARSRLQASKEGAG